MILYLRESWAYLSRQVRLRVPTLLQLPHIGSVHVQSQHVSIGVPRLSSMICSKGQYLLFDACDGYAMFLGLGIQEHSLNRVVMACLSSCMQQGFEHLGDCSVQQASLIQGRRPAQVPAESPSGCWKRRVDCGRVQNIHRTCSQGGRKPSAWHLSSRVDWVLLARWIPKWVTDSFGSDNFAFAISSVGHGIA